MVRRVGSGPMLVLGMALTAAGMLVFAAVSPQGTYLADVLAPSLLVAIGLGLSFVPVTIAAVQGVTPHQSGLASGLINTSRQFGGSLGLAILATVATEHTTSLVHHESVHAALTGGYDRAFLLGAVFAALGAVAAAVLIPRRQRAPQDAKPAAEAA